MKQRKFQAPGHGEGFLHAITSDNVKLPEVIFWRYLQAFARLYEWLIYAGYCVSLYFVNLCWYLQNFLFYALKVGSFVGSFGHIVGSFCGKKKCRHR